MSSNDSRRLMDDRVIQSALNEPEQGQTKSPFKKIMDGFQDIDTSPSNHEDQGFAGASNGGLFNLFPNLVRSMSEHFEPLTRLQMSPEPTWTSQNEQSLQGACERMASNQDFSDLVSWQKANIASLATTEDEVVLTDDGKAITIEKVKPKCPICQETFEHDDQNALLVHVDGHLASNLYCPMCSQGFDAATKREEYQKHVQVISSFLS